MITPSIKTLSTLTAGDADKARELKRILTMKRSELEALPAGAARVRECYPTPSTSDLRLTCLDAALEVDRLGAVWVKCDPCEWNHRDIPGGAVRLGSSPTTAALEREILAFLKD
jgi:hypothetical protein